MPPRTQRRNRAYLNPLIERPAAWTGLAIYLDGSVDECFRRAELDGICLRCEKTLSAAETKGEPSRKYFFSARRIVRSNG